MLRSCAICGADFRPDRVTQLCCSRKCYREEKRMRDLSRRLVNVPAMTFREIARRLGISHALAQLECASALEKLRAAAQREDFR
jgi:predicted nucleic acid-binding Zn ribbon protein